MSLNIMAFILNNRQVKATLDNIIKFINDTYEEYLNVLTKQDIMHV